MLLHRTLLIALIVTVLLAVVLFQLRGLPEIAPMMLIGAVGAIYLALVWSVMRLAADMDIGEPLPFPFWALYLFGGVTGVLFSIWIDRQATARLVATGRAPGFLDFQRP